jgi:hypothetical protein
MVGQDREEANRLQQAKWELTSRIRDESNVPNAFKAGPRIGVAPLPVLLLQQWPGQSLATIFATQTLAAETGLTDQQTDPPVCVPKTSSA